MVASKDSPCYWRWVFVGAAGDDSSVVLGADLYCMIYDPSASNAAGAV